MEVTFVADKCLMAIVMILFIYGLLKFNSWVINGFYQITRGEEKEMPDGTVQSVGKILYPIKKYFDRHRVNYIQFTGDNLSLILHHIISSTPSLKNTISVINGWSFDVHDVAEWEKQKGSIEKRFGIKMGMGTGKWYVIEKEIKIPIIPDWISKPFINCVHCMASLHSTYIYWPAMIMLFGFDLRQLLLWPLYMLALVVFNIQTFKESNI